jgi:hypothetical protein
MDQLKNSTDGSGREAFKYRYLLEFKVRLLQRYCEYDCLVISYFFC